MIYETFLPSYYSSLIGRQQQSMMIEDLYFFVADGATLNSTGSDLPKTAYDEQVVINEIMYGGKVKTSNMIAMVRKITWVPNKVFARYNSRDVNLASKDFYCINSSGYVYKCIDNNNNAPSLYEPQSNIPGAFTLPDGYTWIYMYSLSDYELSELSIQGMIPLIKDPDVVAAAIPGTISAIDITNNGNYQTTLSGTIQQIVSLDTVRIEDIASPITGIYNKSGFFITSGAGQGNYYQISQYTANTSGKFIRLDGDTSTLLAGSTYDIAPYVDIRGNGQDAKARCIMAGSSVGKIELLNNGSKYSLADVNIVANTSHTTSPATALADISPLKGHGSDPYKELYVNHLLINIDIDDYIISNDLPVNEISFNKVGLLSKLDDHDGNAFTANTFNNTFTARITPSSGSFEVGDIVKPLNASQPEAEVVYANTTHIIGVYHDQYTRYGSGINLTNQSGVTGIILNITQPEVRLIPTDIISLTNTDTLKRDDNSRETLQMLVKIK